MTHSHYLMLMALMVSLAARPANADEDRLIDFRGKPLPLDSKLFGPDAEASIKEAADGVRFTLPKYRKDRAMVGLSVPVLLPGHAVASSPVADAPGSSKAATIAQTVTVSVPLMKVRK